jgi:hypothetical protein
MSPGYYLEKQQEDCGKQQFNIDHLICYRLEANLPGTRPAGSPKTSSREWAFPRGNLVVASAARLCVTRCWRAGESKHGYRNPEAW